MPSFINGTPTHVLIVHVVAVLLPVAIVASLALVFVRGARRSFGLLTVAVAAIACFAVPLSFVSGGDLEHRLAPSPLIHHHTDMAHLLLPIAAAFGLALAAFVSADMLHRATAQDTNVVEKALLSHISMAHRPTASERWRRVRSALAVVLVVLSLMTGVQVVRVGDSGAKAVWHGRLLSQSR